MLNNVHLGARAEGANGEHLGKVKFLVANPQTRQLSHVIVEGNGIQARDVVVEIEKIAGFSEDAKTISLNLSAAEFEKLPNFVDRDYIMPGDGGYGKSNVGGHDADYIYPLTGTPLGVDPNTGMQPLAAFDNAPLETEKVHEVRVNVPADALIIQAGAEVEALDGKVGKVREVNYNLTTGEIVSFTIEQGFIFSHEVIVPINLVESSAAHHVTLNATKSDLVQNHK